MRVQADHRSQLLYHLFNHIPFSPFQYKLDPVLVAQPTIYRVLNYKPAPTLDSTGSYAKACGDLLRACGDAALACDGLLEVLARTGTTLLGILVPSLAIVETVTPAEVGCICHVLIELTTETGSGTNQRPDIPVIIYVAVPTLDCGCYDPPAEHRHLSQRYFESRLRRSGESRQFEGEVPRRLAKGVGGVYG